MGVIDVLKPHNLEAFQDINEMIASGIKKIAVPRATGSGKTYLMGALAEQYNDDKKLVLEPTRPLLNSIKEKFDEFSIANTDFITYQKLIRMSDEDIAAMEYRLIFLDEAHHSTAPIWGQKIDCLMSTHSDSIILGTSATTVRNDGVNVVETIFEGNAIGELSLSTAIARKVLPCPHYITAIYRLDDEFEKLKKRIEGSTNTEEEKKEFYRKMQEMKLHFEKSYGIPLILNKYVKVKNGKYLVFCKDKKHLNAMQGVVIDWFQTAGIKDIHSYAVYSDYPEQEKDYKEFCEDNSDSAKILFSINMLNEGLHIEDISGLLMLRTTQSNLIYLQQLGRLLEAGNLDKYLVVFDFVNNFSSVNDGIGLLKEIKEAIAKEKESNLNFDDSGFDDIDTFFVLEQVVEIKEMFREIEGRLRDDWDAMFQEYCKFYEENGHGDVPKTEEYRKLSNWCMRQRQDLKNRVLKEERRKLLDGRGFIWDVYKYRFEKNVADCIKFYEKNGRLPSQYSKNDEERKLMKNIKNYKNYAKNKTNYPQWKKDLLNMIPTLFDSHNSFDKFYRMALNYKKKYGHVDIKCGDIIDGYRIGNSYNDLLQCFKKGKLSDEQVDKLGRIGIDITMDKKEKRFYKNLELAKQAVSEGVIINYRNQTYKGVNFYEWKKTNYEKFTKEELVIMDKLFPSWSGVIRKQMIPILMKDIQTGNAYTYSSMTMAGNVLCNDFGVIANPKSIIPVIKNYLSGKENKPYKGRFMFYLATDEEIKKYLEDNKAS